MRRIRQGGDGDGDERGWGLSRAGQAFRSDGFWVAKDLIPADFSTLSVMVRAQDPPFGAEFSPAGNTPMGAWTPGVMFDEDGRPCPWSEAMWSTIEHFSGVHYGASALHQDARGSRS